MNKSQIINILKSIVEEMSKNESKYSKYYELREVIEMADNIVEINKKSSMLSYEKNIAAMILAKKKIDNINEKANN